jgi:hypothetical protein
MAQLEPTNLSQPENQLSKIAERERAKLIPKNDYKNRSNEYRVTNPDALATGDDRGKGTGVYLDVYNTNAGDKYDITQRTSNLVVNEYKYTNPYTTPPA